MPQHIVEQLSREQQIAALEKDWSLREKLGVIASAQKRLEVLKLSPRKKTIENILNYAKKEVKEFSA